MPSQQYPPKSQASSPKPLQPILGYCTNVHAGSSVEQIKRNLEVHTLAVKKQFRPDDPMAVGLWLPAQAVLEFLPPELDGELDEDKVVAFREWLEARGLYAYTLNGFPATNFHEPVVKHLVYYPDWSTDERVNYTMALALILDKLLPPGTEGSISTLPIGWADSVDDGWAEKLCETIEFLAEFEQVTGRLIHLDLEPEPGCMVGDAFQLVALITSLEMDSEIDPHVLRRHLRICHDVCHSAVMFEPAELVLECVRDAGWSIGKVQISSGLRADFREKKAAAQDGLLAALERFAEDRYLHQTITGTSEDEPISLFFEDLPEALSAPPTAGSEWRIHFHVPIYLDRIGPLETTQSHIIDLLKAIKPEDGIQHFEVETYAWPVLPDDLQQPTLADGIAREMQWAANLLPDHV